MRTLCLKEDSRNLRHAEVYMLCVSCSKQNEACMVIFYCCISCIYHCDVSVSCISWAQVAITNTSVPNATIPKKICHVAPRCSFVIDSVLLSLTTSVVKASVIKPMQFLQLLDYKNKTLWKDIQTHSGS